MCRKSSKVTKKFKFKESCYNFGTMCKRKQYVFYAEAIIVAAMGMIDHEWYVWKIDIFNEESCVSGIYDWEFKSMIRD